MQKSWLLLAIIATTGGCATIADCHYQYVAKSRARIAWTEAKKCLPADSTNRDFAKGYKDGYLDVSLGGNGACPPVPPNCYWGTQFQDREGLARVQQWYQGFAKGAHDALMCYRNTWHNLPSVEQVGVCPTQAWSSDYYLLSDQPTQSLSSEIGGSSEECISEDIIPQPLPPIQE